MPNQPDFQKAFESAIAELCRAIGKDEVKKLDAILLQEKSEIEILKDIVTTFPQFKDFLFSEFNKMNYAIT